MSILKEEGPAPEDVLETAGFVAGDGIKFKVGDTTNNTSMRISIDLDNNGLFNDSVDFVSPWMVYDCVYDENGTLLDENCSESVVFYFNGTNGSGIYDYQLERMVNGSHTNFWLNTIFVGIDDHSESDLPSVGDCFGAGCEEEVVDSSEGVEEGYEKYIPLLMIVSAVGLVGVTISLINEKKDYNEPFIEDKESEKSNPLNDSVVVNNITQNIAIQDSVVIGDVANIRVEEE
ncbi:MAG TPA: hypothetical protein D7H99_02285 [Candidatus Poseidoniales archaeon]|nr:hypothetical protein [Euryarchaeota archaeon]DAC28464.1 MAG TPA: hypothetical protein D7H99_02285 [Candidatus Poseidoniales archaeon]